MDCWCWAVELKTPSFWCFAVRFCFDLSSYFGLQIQVLVDTAANYPEIVAKSPGRQKEPEQAVSEKRFVRQHNWNFDIFNQ